MEELVYELNETGAALARKVADEVTEATGVQRFVAGVLGPTSRTASLSPDVNDPGFRNTTFETLRATYLESVRALVAGGADYILIETIFDTLNAKAAIFAVEQYRDESGDDIPVMISGTITDASGRTLSGQTTGAFWNSVRHARPLGIGLNCALGAEDLRPYVTELARIAETNVSIHPNAGLPNEFGGYDDTPEYMAGVLAGFRFQRAAEYRRWLLRYYTGSHHGYCRCSERVRAPVLFPMLLLLCALAVWNHTRCWKIHCSSMSVNALT